MHKDETAPLTERKVMRRGLLAGLAGLGAAAMLKITGTGRAEAAATALLYPGAAGDGVTINTAHNTTRLSLAEGVSGLPTLSVDATGAATLHRDALRGFAGGNNGWGVSGTGSGGTSSTGYGVHSLGGRGNSGVNGSPGVNANGGPGGAGAIGGHGVEALAGPGPVRAGEGVRATSTSGKGVYGQSTSSDGVHGHSTSGVGLRGTSSGFVGLVGISDSNIGLYGYTVAPNMPAFYAEHLGSSGRIAARYYGDVQVQGNFTVSGGAKNAAVPMPDGTEALMYCQEAPEPYFEDFGRAQLANGVARVQLEREFAGLIRAEDYMVFLTPGGDSNGLYVSQQTPNGFEVRESKAGRSNLAFTYRIVGKRKDIEGKRLARLDSRMKDNIGRMRAESAAKMPAGAMRGRPEAPLVPHEPLVPVQVPEIERRR